VAALIAPFLLPEENKCHSLISMGFKRKWPFPDFNGIQEEMAIP
jgi:hypothetical protein